MIDVAKLSEVAHDACKKHVELLFDGEYHVEVLNQKSQWNPRELRQVFQQSMTVWRKYGDFDVILDADDTPVGYIDHDKWTDCTWRDLNSAQVKAIVSPHDPMSTDIVVREIKRGARDCIDVLVRVAEESDFNVKINPARGAIISFLPADYVMP